VTDGRYYQYSPVLDGRINLPADRTSFQAVYDALAGWDPSGGATGFYNPRKTSNQWVRSRPVTTTIGRHVFFR
jgi:N-acetylmuramoyl-L-alanine amidase